MDYANTCYAIFKDIIDGNMTDCNLNATYILKFDVENPAIASLVGTFRRLDAITDTQTFSVTQFIYDGDGNRVKTIYPDNSWTAYIGDHYEVESDATERSYYFLGSQRIAMRVDDGVTNNLYYFHTDHLGSTSLLSYGQGHASQGVAVSGSEARYLPYGEYRVEPTADLTDVGYTGHRMQDGVGLVYMQARFYVPSLGRFVSADTIVPDPGNPQSLNRFSYVFNRPLVAVDTDGHFPWLIPILIITVVALTRSTPAPPPGVENSQLISNPDGGIGCTDTLLACYQHEDGMKIRDFAASSTYVSRSEFEDLLGAVAEDLYVGWTPEISGDPSSIGPGYGPGYIASRGRFDTPFYNYGSKEFPSGSYPANQEICIEGYGCGARSEINYFAQGMWSAASGDSLEDAIATTNAWIDEEYPNDPLAEGKRLWTQIGYEWYMEWVEQYE